MVSKDDILEQFSNLGIDVEDDALTKCLEICIDAGVDAEEFVETWVAYSVTHLGGADPTVETLSQMEKEEYGKKAFSQSRNHTPSTPVGRSRGKNRDGGLVVYEPGAVSKSALENDILQAYYGTPKGSKKRRPSSPEENLLLTAKKSTTPVAHTLNFSPASFSPLTDTQSSAYSERGNSGQVLSRYGIAKDSDWIWSAGEDEFSPSVDLVSQVGDGTHNGMKYMVDCLDGVARIMDEYLQKMGKLISEHLEPWEPVPLDKPHKLLTNYLGRICADGSARLSTDTILLEGTIDSKSNGKPLIMDLQGMLKTGTPEPFSFFPGQVVVANGWNEKGRVLHVHKIHSKATASLPPDPPQLSITTGPLRVVIGAGPYTLTDGLTFQPLKDLVEYVRVNKPHVLILIGPFLDLSHPQITGEEGCNLAESFASYFDRIVESIMSSLKGINIQVVLVSNSNDAHSIPVYPTPPYDFPNQSRAKQYLKNKSSHEPKLIMAPDPCFINLQGVIIGVTSNDILKQLSKEELSSGNQPFSRMHRLSGHLIQQRNFYPLCPPASGVSLDIGMWNQMCFMPYIPHVLILPSDLRCFIMDVDGCLVINPERVSKSAAGGSFAQFEVESSCKWDPSICGNIKAQVRKI